MIIPVLVNLLKLKGPLVSRWELTLSMPLPENTFGFPGKYIYFNKAHFRRHMFHTRNLKRIWTSWWWTRCSFSLQVLACAVYSFQIKHSLTFPFFFICSLRPPFPEVSWSSALNLNSLHTRTTAENGESIKNVAKIQCYKLFFRIKLI